MGASSIASGLAFLFLAGCGGWVAQPGLANAPGLNGTTAETRVHDAIANGHDACERSEFPQGEVLRGHIPPCTTDQRRLVLPTALSWNSVSSEPSPSPIYWFGVCPAGLQPHTLGSDKGLAAFSLSAPKCDRWADRSPSF
jgi:hypothetical protein